MDFKEIRQRLIDRDESVTQCFFFWDGPTLERIEEIRRNNPQEAAQMRRPICNTCRPLLLKTLNSVFDGKPFDYTELVTDFYCYIMEDRDGNGCLLTRIVDPNALMGWIQTTAFRFFLNLKRKRDKVTRTERSGDMLDNRKVDPPFYKEEELAIDTDREDTRDFVKEVLAKMPNREYAQFIDDVVLEYEQYTGQERIIKRRKLAEKCNMTTANFDMKVSRAKKQFKDTAKSLM